MDIDESILGSVKPRKPRKSNVEKGLISKTRKKPGPKPSGKPPRDKMSYYLTAEEAGRIRAAWKAAATDKGWQNVTQMQAEIIMKAVKKLEKEYNNGKPFRPLAKGEIAPGRPVEND